MGLDDVLYRAVTGIPRHRRKFALILVFTLTSLYMMHRRRRDAIKKATKDTTSIVDGTEEKKKRVGVDAQFLSQLKRLLPICIPGIASKEMGLLLSLALILVARTGLIYGLADSMGLWSDQLSLETGNCL